MTWTATVAAAATAAVESRKFQRGTQYLAAAIVTLGGFIVGTTLGWMSPAGPMLVNGGQYPFVVTEENVSWIGALMPLGALVGCLVMAVGVLDKCGRKSLLIMLTMPTILGWQLIVKAQSVRWIYVGRLLSGFSSGSYSVIVPMYISEIAANEIRGVLGTYFQLQFAMGILYAYVAGSYFVDVRDLSAVCALVPVAFLCLLAVVPESPVYHLARGNVAEARRSLRFYRGPRDGCDLDGELDAMQKSLTKADNNRVPIAEAFKTTPAKRGLLLGLGAMVFQQFTGINAVIFYATTIFHETGSRIEPHASTIVVGAIAVASTYAATHAVDRQGRKALLLCSAVMMGVCTFIIGGFFCAKEYGYDVSAVGYVPLVSLCTFVVMFSVGFGPVPWILIGEIFPAQIKGIGSSIVCMSNWFFAFLVTKFFISLVSIISIYNTFWLFTLFSGLGTLFVWFVVPETKGKTMEEIQVMLGADFTLL